MLTSPNAKMKPHISHLQHETLKEKAQMSQMTDKSQQQLVGLLEDDINLVINIVRHHRIFTFCSFVSIRVNEEGDMFKALLVRTEINTLLTYNSPSFVSGSVIILKLLFASSWILYLAFQALVPLVSSSATCRRETRTFSSPSFTLSEAWGTKRFIM